MFRVDVCRSWTDKLSFHRETGRITYQMLSGLTLSPQTDLWIVRHAETFANQKKILQGSDQENEDTVLSPEGEAQAESRADKLAHLLIKADPEYARVTVLSSPARRAGQTAQFFLRKFRSLSPLVCHYSEHAFLHEIRFGEISGMTEEQVFQMGDDYRNFARMFRLEGNALVRLNGGESFHDLLLRVRDGFGAWQSDLLRLEGSSRQAIVIFTHMITASALRVLMRDEGLLDICHQTGQPFVNWRKIIQNTECLFWDEPSRRMSFC